ncbi:MAG: amidohydrolase family protein [Emcibacter sp.]|nr:amidohydrolase family protein [Emcibacter sp.]
MRMSLLRIIVAASVAMSYTAHMSHAETLAIKGGTLHTMSKKGVLNNATILIKDGRITAVGQNITIPANAEIINAVGKIIIPGAMHSGSRLALSEISMTEDSNEHSAKKSPFSAAFDVQYGLRSNSVVVTDNRRQGLTHAITQPSGSDGIFYGSSALISLTGDAGMRLGKGPMIANPANGGNRNVSWAKIRLIFDQVKFYDQNRNRIKRGEWFNDFLLSGYNMDALVAVLKGRQKLVLMVNSEDDLRQAIALKRDYKLDVILSGATEAWKVARELAAAKIPVIINPLEDLPGSFGKLAATLRNAALLDAAGVIFAISPGGMAANHNAFHIYQMAGLAVAHGLSWERALEAITIRPAEIFGFDKSLGSVEKGKLANLVVWDGDPLEVTSNTSYVIVGGVNHPLISRRTLLRDRYLDLTKKPLAFQ